jgi:uncharacterized membrane protein YkvA (DUF1232 family)
MLRQILEDPMATKSKTPARKKTRRASRPRKTRTDRGLLTRADLEQIVNELACSVAPADVAALLQKEAALRERAEGLGPEFDLLRRQLLLFLDCLRDFVNGRCPQIPFSTIAVAAAALLYFSKEVDLVPDFLPRLGKLDDAAVVAVAVERARKGLERYCAATGRSLQELLPVAGDRELTPSCP